MYIYGNTIKELNVCQAGDVINDETRQILKTDKLKDSDAEFLIAVGKIDELELVNPMQAHLLALADMLNYHGYQILYGKRKQI